MNRKIIILAIGLILANTGFAQEEWEDDSRIDDKEIVIEKDKKIELPIANKNYEKIPFLAPTREYSLKPYQLQEFSLSYSPVNPGIRVKKLADEPIPKLYGNYIKAGFGNYSTPLFEAFISNKRNEEYLVGASLRHLSSGKGPVDNDNSASGATDLSIFGKAFTDKATIGGNVTYENRRNYFYGYDPSLEVSRDTIEQSFNTIGISLNIEGSDVKSPFQYELGVSYSSISDNFDASESMFGADFKGSYKTGETTSIGLESNVTFSTYEDNTSQDRSVFRITPTYNFHYSDFILKAGFNMVFENDTISNKDDLHFYPVLEATYPVQGDIKFTAGVKGDIDQVFYHDLSRENPWLNSQIPLIHTNRSVEFYGGLKGKISNSFDFSAMISTANLKNLYSFVNDPSDSIRFIPLYDVGTTSRLKIDGEIGYEYKDLFFLRARAEVFNYETDSLKEAWHRPNLKLSLSGGYNLYDKILFEASLLSMSGIKAQDPSDLSTVKLDGIFDLNAKVEYLISDRASVFLNLYNIFSSEYERYLNYPSRGFMAVGGLTYSF